MWKIIHCLWASKKLRFLAGSWLHFHLHCSWGNISRTTLRPRLFRLPKLRLKPESFQVSLPMLSVSSRDKINPNLNSTQPQNSRSMSLHRNSHPGMPEIFPNVTQYVNTAQNINSTFFSVSLFSISRAPRKALTAGIKIGMWFAPQWRPDKW